GWCAASAWTARSLWCATARRSARSGCSPGRRPEAAMARIAVIQRPPVFLDRGETLKIAVQAVAEVAASGARLAVFPETFVPGYPAWMWRLRPGPDMALTERLHARLRANSISLAADELAPLRQA